jgi:hypothetical protein
LETEVPAEALRDLVLGILARRDASGLDIANALACDGGSSGPSIPEVGTYFVPPPPPAPIGPRNRRRLALALTAPNLGASATVYQWGRY